MQSSVWRIRVAVSFCHQSSGEQHKLKKSITFIEFNYIIVQSVTAASPFEVPRFELASSNIKEPVASEKKNRCLSALSANEWWYANKRSPFKLIGYIFFKPLEISFVILLWGPHQSV